MLSTEDVQALVGRGRDAWAPRQGEGWETFVRRKASSFAPGWWRPFERASFRRAIDQALARGEQRRKVRALVLPFWVALNEAEEPSDGEWKKKIVVTAEPEDELLFEIDLRARNAAWARVTLEIAVGAFVAPALGYASVPSSAARFGRFLVLDSKVRAVVEAIHAGEQVALAPSPATTVPAFAASYVPAFELGAAPADVSEAAERVAKKLSSAGA